MVLAVDGNRGAHRPLLEHWFSVGVEACLPTTVMPPVLPTTAPRGRNIVLGAGKAAADMAAAAHAHLEGVTVGLVVTRYGHGTDFPTGSIKVIEASHPVPDEQSVVAGTEMLALAKEATPDDRVVFLVSGGGSSLLCAPIDGVSLDQKRAVTQHLLHAGAPINEINCVRKHLSRVKGGGLAYRVAASELLTFAISDVVGDELSDIAAGPTIPFARDATKAIEILERYACPDIQHLAEAIRVASDYAAPEHSAKVVASCSVGLEAIKREAQMQGWHPIVLGDDLEGDAAAVGRAHAELVKSLANSHERVALISGGELTVTVANANGRGGPNLEYLSGLMLGLEGMAGVEAIACDSDGIDGSQDNAGGYIDATSLTRCQDQGIDVRNHLRENTTYDCFAKLGDLIVTGPTRTNVNDFRVILVTDQRG